MSIGTKCGYNNIIKVGLTTKETANSSTSPTDGSVNLYNGSKETEYTYILNSLKTKEGYSNYADSSNGISWNQSNIWKTNIFDFSEKMPTIKENANLNETTYQAKFYINGALKYVVVYSSTETVVAPTVVEKVQWFSDASFTTQYTFGSTLSSDVSIYGKVEEEKQKYVVTLTTDQAGVTLSPNNYKVEEGGTYTGTITNNSNLTITGVSVTMVGTQNPTFTYDTTTGTVTITNVTGNTQITPIYNSTEVKPLSECTPAEIQRIANGGNVGTDSNGEKVWIYNEQEWFHIGDETSITLTDGQIFKIALADFYHDVSADGTASIPFTFVGMSLLKDTHNMNSTKINTGGWAESEMRTYLNSDVFNLFPTEWQNIISSTKKESTIGDKSRDASSSENKLFLLSASEVGYASLMLYEADANTFYSEGSLYPIFSEENSTRIRYTLTTDGQNDSTGWWWLRSPIFEYARQFQRINSAGSMNYTYASTAGGICPAFGVGAETLIVSLVTDQTNVYLEDGISKVEKGNSYTGKIINNSKYKVSNVDVTMEGNSNPTFTFDSTTLSVNVTNITGCVTIKPIYSYKVELITNISGISISPNNAYLLKNATYTGTLTNTSGKTVSGFKIVEDDGHTLTLGVDYTYDSSTKVLTINTITKNVTITPLINDTNGIPTEVASLSSLTPETIKQIATYGTLATDSNNQKVWKVGDVEWLHIGDYTSVVLTNGIVYNIAIADFNHDVGSDGSTVLPFTFVGTSLLSYTHNMNSADEENTYGLNVGGWKDSEMYTYLNTNIWNLFPTDWKSVITTAQKTSTIGNMSSEVTLSDNNLWLLSYSEVGLSNSSYDTNYYSKEGSAYPIFTDNDSRVRSAIKSTTPVTNWWLRSPNPEYDNRFMYVADNGSGKTSYAKSALGLCPAFAVGAGKATSTIKTLAECTPAEIQTIAKDGELGTDSSGNKVWKYNGEEYFHIGDETTITLTDGQEIKFAIADFNHDVGPNGTTVIPFTFVAMSMLKDTYAMNSNRNSTGGWAGSEMNTYLNSTVLNLFPTEWQNIMSTTTKKSTSGGGSTTISSSTCKLWLPSVSEVGLSTSSPFSDEGTLYPIFSDATSRIRKNASGSAGYWWLRSPDTGYFRNFCSVDTSGALYEDTADNTYGVVPAFCVSGEITQYFTVTLTTDQTTVTLNPDNNEVEKGATYTGVIKNSNSSIITNIAVEMDGTTNPEFTYNYLTGEITISNVTGDVQITPIFRDSEVKALSDCTPAEISAIAKSGELGTDAFGNHYWIYNEKPYFYIGDTTTITLTDGQTLTFAIADFNHDVEEDGTTVMPFTFVAMNAMTDTHAMNSTSTNTGGWANAEMRTYLDSTVLNLFPTEWQNIMSTATKKSSIGGGTPSSPSTTITSSTSKLWLLSVSEVGCSTITPYGNEGTKYPIFSDNDSRIRKNASGTAVWWSMRSPTKDSKTTFDGVGTGGGWYSSSANTARSIVPAFCVGVPAVNIPQIDKKALSEYTPAEIQTIAQYGELGTDSSGNKVWKYNGEEFFHIGDETTITLTDGQSLTVALADFNHDVGSDGSTVLPFTFVAMNLLENEYYINPEANSGGWALSEMKTYLNSYIWSLFPTDWQDIISPATKKSTIGDDSTEISSSYSELWLLSMAEVGISTDDTLYDEEGTLYPIFSAKGSRVRNYLTGYYAGEAGYWWLRSPTWDDSFCFIYEEDSYKDDYDGDDYYNNIWGSEYPGLEHGINLAFSVGRTATTRYTIELLTDQEGITLTPDNYKLPIGACGVYTGTIKSSDGSVIPNISVEMDGTTNPEFTYNYLNGEITISNVTGNVKITPVFRDSEVKLLSSCTPTEIMNIAKSGELGTDSFGNHYWVYNGKPYFYIGDTITITLTDGQEIKFALADFNHDVGGDGSTVMPFTFVALNTLKDSKKANETDTNAGGWANSSMREYLNTTVLNLFPTEWQNVISIATKKSTIGGGTSSTPSTTISSSTSKLWLLSVTEVGLTTSNRYSGEGTLYPIFSDNDSRIRKNASDVAQIWWLRSPYVTSPYFCSVSNYGVMNSRRADYTAGVVPAFCVSGDLSGSYTITLTTDKTGVTLTPNNAVTVEGGGYSGTITNSDGSVIPNVSIEMEGTTNPEFKYNYANGQITIFNITGNVTITPIFKDSEVKALSNYTPAEIRAIASIGNLGTDAYGNTCWIYNGKPYFYIGDQTTITLTDGQVIRFEIADFNHDVGSDGTTTLPFTFVAMDILKDDHRMNATHTNAGGWASSEMKTYLNSTVLNLFPTEWQNVISDTTKKSTIGSNSKTISSSSSKLWFLSVSEVGLSTLSPYTEEGSLYPIFSGDASRIRKYASGSVGWWWLRSPYDYTDHSFYGVHREGVLSYMYAEMADGILPAFCIGSDTYYTVTLTTDQENVTLSPDNFKVEEGGTYTGTITNKSGATITGVAVEMAGTQNPTFTYNTTTGIITISNITGDTQITPIYDQTISLKSLSECTPAEIQEIAKNGELGTDSSGNKVWKYNDEEFFHIGDTIAITLTDNQTLTVALADFNHDVGGDGSTVLPFTFVAMNLLSASHNMDSSGVNIGGWKGSDMRTYLNNDIFNLFPTDWQKIISPATKKTLTNVESDSNVPDSELVSSVDKLWLVSYTESGQTYQTEYSVEGTIYPIFSDSASRQRSKVGGSAEKWWLRSYNEYRSYVFINTEPGIGGYASSNEFGVCPAFCVGGTTVYLETEKSGISLNTTQLGKTYKGTLVNNTDYKVSGVSVTMLGTTTPSYTFNSSTLEIVVNNVTGSLIIEPNFLFNVTFSSDISGTSMTANGQDLTANSSFTTTITNTSSTTVHGFKIVMDGNTILKNEVDYSYNTSTKTLTINKVQGNLTVSPYYLLDNEVPSLVVPLCNLIPTEIWSIGQAGTVGTDENGMVWKVGSQVWFHIGDTTSITLSDGQVLKFALADFNHDTSVNEEIIPFSFVALNLFEIDEDLANELTDGSTNWEDSGIRDYLLTTVLDLFPESWQNTITQAKKSSVTTDYETIESYDMLWFLSAGEVGADLGDYTLESESAYQIFTDDASRIRYSSSYEYRYYWLRSSCNFNESAACVDSGGYADEYWDYSTNLNMCIGFCI